MNKPREPNDRGPFSNTTPTKTFRISEVAKMAGVSSSTIRLWERQGLIRPGRTESKYRSFDVHEAERIRDIARMRNVQGLNVAAIKRVLPKRTDDLNQPIGARLRMLRQRLGLSLRDVEKKTGLAFSFVSGVERTSRGASLTSLKKLATCYGTTVTELLAGKGKPGKRAVLTRAGKGRLAPIMGPEVIAEQRNHFVEMLDCQIWTLAPGAASNGAYSHPGEEFIYVIHGEFEIDIEGHGRFHAKTGDSLHFHSTWQHSWRNPGATDTVLLWINTPPTF
jgi:DNA-binding transcriptional MerR regulator/mannose-6-phosphate isomerase-like protein (cupin superfamily)